MLRNLISRRRRTTMLKLRKVKAFLGLITKNKALRKAFKRLLASLQMSKEYTMKMIGQSDLLRLLSIWNKNTLSINQKSLLRELHLMTNLYQQLRKILSFRKTLLLITKKTIFMMIVH